MIILCDVDGVLADFTGAACKELSDILGRKVSRNECKQWDFADNFNLSNKQAAAFDKRVCSKGFCAGLKLLPGAKKAVDALRSLGFVYFVTTPWPGSKYWMPERTRWLIDNLETGEHEVIHTCDKSIILGDVIIDDKPIHLVRGERKLRVLIPNAANAAYWRNVPHRQSENDKVLITKSWPEILSAVRGVK